MPSAPHPDAASTNPALDLVTSTLDPVLAPLGFIAGQAAASEEQGQIIFCRGDMDSEDDGCVDLVIDLKAVPDWRVVDVRYWGFSSDRWHLRFDRDAALPEQVAALAETLPEQLA